MHLTSVRCSQRGRLSLLKPIQSLLALLFLAALFLAACGGVADHTGDPAIPTPSGPRRGGSLTLALSEDFTTFHPFFETGARDYEPIFYDPVVRIGDQGNFEPWLAESWEISPDKTSITLHLRPGVKFHNGRELKASDIVWSVEQARNPELGHQLSARFPTVTDAVALDDYTLRIDYREPTAAMLDGLARLYIYPQEAAASIDTLPVGTGPFQYSSWIPGDRLIATRFPDYWRHPGPYLDEVALVPLPDLQSRILALMEGEVDAILDVPLDQKAALEAGEDIVVGENPPGFAFYAFLINTQAPPFDDVRVRQALNYALDRQKIVDTVFAGQATPIVLPYPPSSWAYAPDLANRYTYDPERAKALLAEAGYPAGFSTQMLVRGTSGPHLEQARVFQKELADIGIEVELQPAELADYWPRLSQSAFTLVSHTAGDATVDPSGLFESAPCCRAFANFFGIEANTTWFPEYRAVIRQAGIETDQTKRKGLYHRALEILLEQGWTIPVAWRQSVYAHRADVMDLRVDMDGLVWLDQTWLKRPEPEQ